MAPKQRSRKKWALPVSIVAVLIVIGLLVFSVMTYVKYNVVPRGAVFTIDGRAYSKQEVSNLIAFPVESGEWTQEKAAKQAFELLKRKRTAQKLGIEISQSAVVMNKRTLFGGNDAALKSEWAHLLAYDDILNTRLSAAGQSKDNQIVGAAFVFPFSGCIEFMPGSEPDCLNDEQQIKKDRDYAKERAEHYRAKLQSRAITPEQALKEIRADARLGFGGTAGLNASAKFENGQQVGAEDLERTLDFSGDVNDYITSDKIQKGLSPILEGKIVPNALADHNDPRNEKVTYYFFTDVTTLSKAITKKQFNEELKKLPARYQGFGDADEKATRKEQN